MKWMMVVFLTLLLACRKDGYDSVNGSLVVSGRVLLIDTVSRVPTKILPAQTVYVNTGSDSSTYLFKVSPDSSGVYAIPFLKRNQSYTLFTRYAVGQERYEGVAQIRTSSNDAVELDIAVYRQFTNGLALRFTDSLAGPLPGLAFRMYSSRVAAQFDSTAYAVANTRADQEGSYYRLDLPAAHYYVVAKQEFGTLVLNLFDSVEVLPNGLVRKEMVLK